VRERGRSADFVVYAAENQVEGRGQRGNRWSSRRGENLTFSISVKPSSIVADRQSVISVITALAVCDYLESKDITSKIKWPNDIYVNDRKICGILVENRLSGTNLVFSVIGIGLNLNQTEFPPDIPNPTSIALETGSGKRMNPREELPVFLERFRTLYGQVGDSALESALYDRYENILYRRGELHDYRELSLRDGAVTGEVKGVIRGVDRTSFRLLLETELGMVKDYGFKEIAYVL